MPVRILNPRRKDWDSNWKQDINNPKFKEQVDWEINGIDNADIVLFYFDALTKSPITLYELRYILGDWSTGPQAIVCCPRLFWRRGNVEIYTKGHETAKFTDNWEKFMSKAKKAITKKYEARINRIRQYNSVVE